MHQLLNLIHHQKVALDLSYEDIAKRMVANSGQVISKEAVGHYFSGNSGVPMDRIGDLFFALEIIYAKKGAVVIEQEEHTSLKYLAGKWLNGPSVL